jgi:hypothetical protein
MGSSKPSEQEGRKSNEGQGAAQADRESKSLPLLRAEPNESKHVEGGQCDAGPSEHKQEDLNGPPKLSGCRQL